MRVGTSSDSVSPQHTVEDHPHACGDKIQICPPLNIIRGSSPCVWGQDTVTCARFACDGIIPMRVGTSCWGCGSGSKGRDHPHACGDKITLKLHSNCQTGSSPCVWGQVLIVVIYLWRYRIIPMRVGTSPML